MRQFTAPVTGGVRHGGSSAMLLIATLSIVTGLVQATKVITFPLVPHHVQRMRRHRALLEQEANNTSSMIRRREEALQVGALYQGYGTHYLDLWCGTPPQRQTVIVDTGSGVTAFPCSGCQDCGVPRYHIDQLFDESQSSTFRHNTCDQGCVSSRSHCAASNQCQLSMSYAEGSRWDAYEAVDSCYVGGPHEHPLLQDDGGTDDLDPGHAKNFAFDLVFGCQTYLTGLFKTQMADGIMGMDTRNEAFWKQMYMAGKMGNEQKFSLCFSRQPTQDRKGTEAGALTLGGVDERFDKSPMVYTPNASGGRSGFFSVRIRRMYLRDGSAGESAMTSKNNPTIGVTPLEVSDTIMNSGGIIVDSGTTDTYWNRGIANAFQAAFQKLAGRPHNNAAISLTHEQLMALPTILFQLESSQIANPDVDAFHTTGLAGALDPKHPYDVLLAFPPSHYMEYDPRTEKYTSRFYPTEGGGSVLGANAMMGHNILFNADKDQIGWSESDCDYTNIVTSNGFDFSITGNLETAPPGAAPVAAPVDTSIPLPIVPELSPTLPGPPLAAPTAPPQVPIAPPITPPQEPPTTPPQEAPVSPPTLPPVESGSSMSTQDSKGTYPILAGMAIMACCGACLMYGVWRYCSSSSSSGSTDYKYQQAAVDEVELVSYQDEPDDDDHEKPTSNGQNGFHENSKPKRKPEFHGDFI